MPRDPNSIHESEDAPEVPDPSISVKQLHEILFHIDERYAPDREGWLRIARFALEQVSTSRERESGSDLGILLEALDEEVEDEFEARHNGAYEHPEDNYPELPE